MPLWHQLCQLHLSAISNGARHGILFKGGIHLENLGNLKAIALDKTGTLTKGKPEVTDVIIREDLSEEDFLFHVASVENYSNHPFATAIVRYAKTKLQKDIIKPDNMEDISGNGVQAYFKGMLWQVGKADFVGRRKPNDSKTALR